MARYVLVIAVLAVSTAAPLVHYASPTPALTVAAARVCLTGLLLFLIAPNAWGHFARLPRREMLFVVAAGLLLGLHFGVWITSLYLTSTAASVALVATQPIFAALFARVLGDRISRREMIGIAIAGLGCLALGGGDLLTSTGWDAVIGDGLAILGAAAAAGYLLIGRRMRVSVPLTPYLALVNIIAGASLLIAALLVGVPFFGLPDHAYLAIVLMTVIPSLLGHSLLNWSVRRMPTHLVALAILGEPIGSSLMTLVFFSEIPPAHAVLGGAVILLGIFVGFIRLRGAPPTSEQENTRESEQESARESAQGNGHSSS